VGVDPDVTGVLDGSAAVPGWDDWATATIAVIRIKTVGRKTRVFEVRRKKELKLPTPRKYKSEPHAR
jgi:hypothetical protein